MNSVYRYKYKSFLNKGLLYLILAYTLFMFGRSIWINYRLHQEIGSINLEIKQIEAKNKNLENLILYYQSDSFREIEARQKLGYKKPDEKVLMVPVKKYDDYASEIKTDQQNIEDKNISEESSSNSKLWWYYLTQ